MSARTLKLAAPYLAGADVDEWREELLRRFAHWNVDYPLAPSGPYDVGLRAATATVLHGLGIAQDAMADGVTPWLRVKVRDSRLTATERARYVTRAKWRRDLADKFAGGGTAAVLAKIFTHSNGWTGRNGHDGTDLICPANAVGHAICKGEIVRADDAGWWGEGAPRDPAVRAKGDGIVILRALVTIGPIKKGMCFGYGHAEHPRVQVGDIVDAGEPICHAGLANAWHFHFMVNSGAPEFWRGTFARGVGDRDPWPLVDYAIKHA